MRTSTVTQKRLLTVIYLLYILLFVYAAISKLLDFENFRIQLGQSPMLSVYASWLVWVVPMVELIIATLLLIPKSRLIGLICSYTIMVMFSIYIYVILTYASFIPCSCGGILEKLGWEEHLMFNIGFTFLAFIAILISIQPPFNYLAISKKQIFFLLSLLTFIGISSVVLLFKNSENIIHHKNPFIRSFPHHPATMEKRLDMGYNSYYFAGSSKGKVYLGNTTAPLHLLEVDSSLRDTNHIHIQLNRKDFPFRAVKVRVMDSLFFVMDGTVPCIYKGNIKDWNASLWMLGRAYFSLAEPISQNRIAIRARSTDTNENLLGLLIKTDDIDLQLKPRLLIKQAEGIFSTDGILISNRQRKEVIYPYYYRNQYTVTDYNLNLTYRSHTIDTISKAQIKISPLSDSVKQLVAPPLIVNKAASSYGDYLLVHSNILGSYESVEMWKEASIIDVYDLSKRTYEFSFYLYHLGNKKARAFIIYGSQLYALIGNQLVSYRLKPTYFKSIEDISPHTSEP